MPTDCYQVTTRHTFCRLGIHVRSFAGLASYTAFTARVGRSSWPDYSFPFPVSHFSFPISRFSVPTFSRTRCHQGLAGLESRDHGVLHCHLPACPGGGKMVVHVCLALIVVCSLSMGIGAEQLQKNCKLCTFLFIEQPASFSAFGLSLLMNFATFLR